MKELGEVRLSDSQDYKIFLQGSLRGRNRFYFCPYPSRNDVVPENRVSFHSVANEFLFSGILLDQSLRGQGLSPDFVKVLQDFATCMKVRFERTTCIRKPIIAKLLKSLGAQAFKGDKLVEILPYKVGLIRTRPSISPLSKKANSLRSESGKFFTFVPPAEVINYPLSIPDHAEVYMYDQFCLKKIKNPSQVQAEFSTRILHSLL